MLLDLLAAAKEWNDAALNTPVSVKAAAEGIDAMVQGYVDDLTKNFLDVLDGGMSVPAAVRGHHLFVTTLADRAYDAGMEEGGADPDDKDDADEAAVNDWTSTQEGAIGGLWDDVKQLRKDKPDLDKDEYAARQLTINDRLGQWGESLRNLYSLAKAMAQKNKSGTWKLGATEQHCGTCAELDGQTHRLSWYLKKGYIPQQNGSATLECGGWHCDCTIEAEDGTVLLP